MAKGGASLKVYKYYLSIHYVACLSPIDAIIELRFDNRNVYTGVATGGTLTIDKQDLYGGMDREGGVSGEIDVMLGAKTQTANAGLLARFSDTNAYRGVVSLLLRNFYVGMNYYMKPFSIVAKRIHATSSGAIDWLPAYAEPISGQMNGVHIIRDLLTDTINGQGIPVSNIGTTFDAAAITCFNEGYGFTFFFRDGKSIDEYLKIVKAHLNAEVYQSRTTGKYEIKLIRQDYTVGSLPRLTTSIVKEVVNLKRTLPAELFSRVVIQYTNGVTYDDAVEVLEDFTLSSKQGGFVEKSIEFRGCRTRTLAKKLAMRELSEISTQVFAGEVICNRDAETYNLGDAFVIEAAANAYLDQDLVCRVAKMDLGSPTDNKIKITFVQDVFAVQEAPVFIQPESSWVDVVNNAAAATNRFATEAPYYLFAKINGDVEAKAVDTTVSYIAMAADAPTTDSFLAGIWTNGTRKGILHFCPYAEVAVTMTRTSTTLNLQNLKNFQNAAVGDFIQVGVELMGIISIAVNVITVKRGVLDTIPISHSIGEKVFAWQSLNGTDKVQYLLTETVPVRLTPRTPKEEYAYASAPTDNITIVGRMHLPYPPGDLKLNTLYWPSVISVADLVLTWTSRNRFQQTINLVDYYTGSITSEPSVTYTTELRRQDTNAILTSGTGLTGLTFSHNTSVPLSGTVASLTNSGTTATLTMSAAHGLTTGRKISVLGASPAPYNGIFTVTVTGANTLTYVMASTPGGPATGAVVEASIYAGTVILSLWSVNPNGSSFQKISHTFTLE